jgi:DNA-binding response OmpR family regulator
MIGCATSIIIYLSPFAHALLFKQVAISDASMSPEINFCPHCGGALDSTIALRAGPYTYSKTNGFRSNDQPIGLSTHAQIILGTIMSARGSIVGNATLAHAIETHAMRIDNVIYVQLCRARKIFAARGETWPIATQRALGKYWIGPDVIGG